MANKVKGNWELDEWGSPRERNRLIKQDRDNGMTFKDLGEKYQISTDRARQVYLKECRLQDRENRKEGEDPTE